MSKIDGVPLLDLKAQYATIRDDIQKAVDEVFESQYFILGPQVKALEEEIAAYCGTKHAIGVSSGTDALLLALMALDIAPGDEIITTPFTFFATAGVIHRLNAVPVFVDIEPETFNIDPAKIEAAITPKTRAILPVHLYGQCVEMDEIMAIAGKHGLRVVEDAAQAIGSEYKGRRAGSLGDIGCFSFFPSKNLGAAGDGGVVTTNDDELAKKMVMMRVHGGEPKYYHSMVGGNFRLDAIQAAVLRVKLKKLDEWTAGRQRNAADYDRRLGEAGLVADKVVPPPVKQSRHIFNQYVPRVRDRDALFAHLKAKNIGCDIYYPICLHLQECFAHLGGKPGEMPVSEKAAEEVIAIPIYSELTKEQRAYVIDAIAEFYKG